MMMSWQRKPHGVPIIPATCPLQVFRRGFNIYTLKSSVKVGEENILLPQQKKANESLLNTTACPPRYEVWMAMQEFCKVHKPKINKLKGAYSATANLIFQSWLKDIWVHVEN